MKYNPFATNEGCIRFKNAIKNYSDKRALSPEEVTRVFESVEIPEDKTSVSYLLAMRDLIVLELLATTGMRRAELTPIKVGDIKPYTGKYIVNITGKGNKTRVMVIANKVKKHIDDYITARGLTYEDINAPLITNHTNNRENNLQINDMTIYRIVKKYADKAGIGVDDIAPHNFRHTYCTQAIDMGFDIYSVQDSMGHASVATTRRYEHLYRTVTDSPSDKLSKLYGI
jgi:site-specific recombinase XerD